MRKLYLLIIMVLFVLLIIPKSNSYPNSNCINIERPHNLNIKNLDSYIKYNRKVIKICHENVCYNPSSNEDLKKTFNQYYLDTISDEELYNKAYTKGFLITKIVYNDCL